MTRFDELGGHSLLAVQILSRVETELGHQLTLDAMLAAPTIRLSFFADSIEPVSPEVFFFDAKRTAEK